MGSNSCFQLVYWTFGISSGSNVNETSPFCNDQKYAILSRTSLESTGLVNITHIEILLFQDNVSQISYHIEVRVRVIEINRPKLEEQTWFEDTNREPSKWHPGNLAESINDFSIPFCPHHRPFEENHL